MATTNDVTGDRLVSKTSSQQYKDNWNLIFGKKKDSKEETKEKKDDETTGQ